MSGIAVYSGAAWKRDKVRQTRIEPEFSDPSPVDLGPVSHGLTQVEYRVFVILNSSVQHSILNAGISII
jgi:hypothetical protein